MLQIVKQLPSWKFRQTHLDEGKKTLPTFMSWDIMKSLSWENSLTNLPLGDVMIVGNLLEA